MLKNSTKWRKFAQPGHPVSALSNLLAGEAVQHAHVTKKHAGNNPTILQLQRCKNLQRNE
jgi:hypothetical protein